MIHPAAIIHPEARLGRDVHIGAYAVIESGVEIGDGCRIGHHAVIEGPTRIGPGNRIFPHACIGTAPQDVGYRDEPTRLEIGEGNVIREFATIHRATTKEHWLTRVGSHGLFMAYAHIAHDCMVGDHVVMANAATLGGHVQVGDHAHISGLCAIHQFVRIGAYAMLGGGTIATLDVPPFVTAAGNHVRLFGLNRVGLRRQGFSGDDLRQLKQAYQLLFRSGQRMEEAIAALRESGLDSPHVARLVEFVATSRRGVAR